MKNGKKIDAIKVLGFGAMALGLVANMISGFVEDKKADAMITKKVNEAVTTALKKKDD